MDISGGKTPASPVPMVHRYRRHEPEKTALYPIIEQHLFTFTDELTRHHAALPAFVVNEFRFKTLRTSVGDDTKS